MNKGSFLRKATAAAVAGAITAALLAGCTVGPRYVRPRTDLPADFVEARGYDAAQPVASRLWHSFGDPVLDRLIDAALARNKTLAQATAQLKEARALRGLENFAFLPTVTAAASRNTTKYSNENPLIPPNIGKVTTFTAGFDASWEIDLFGGSVSARRAAVAEERAAGSAVEAARQSVVAEVAQTYFSLRAEQERLRVQRRNVSNLEENQRLLEARLDGGRGTELDVASARALYLGTASRLPQTEATIARDEQRLAVLTAEPVETLRTQLGPPAPLPQLPALVTIGTPEAWLRRRPDVLQAEQKLISATAQIGVEASNFFPQLTLLGGFNWTAQVAKDIGSSAARQWNYGPSLSWSFLDIGRVRQRVLAQKARAAGAVAAYENTVLLALEETENGLSGYRAANQTAVALEGAVKAARDATTLAQARFDGGAIDTLDLLQTERSQLDLEDQLATAESQRATALAALYKALVGDFAAAGN
jgi:multidrug efflux system outer membrane protein